MFMTECVFTNKAFGSTYLSYMSLWLHTIDLGSHAVVFRDVASRITFLQRAKPLRGSRLRLVLPHCFEPHYESEAKCKVFITKTELIFI